MKSYYRPMNMTAIIISHYLHDQQAAKCEPSQTFTTFHSCSLAFNRVPMEFVSLDSCSSVFIGVHSCSTRIDRCSFVFIRVQLVFIRIDRCLFVLIRGH